MEMIEIDRGVNGSDTPSTWPRGKSGSMFPRKIKYRKYLQHRAIKSVLRNKLMKGVIIKELDWNLFTFQFFSKVDKEYVFNEAPRAFNGNILMLKEITGLEQPSEIVFNKARFWVKAYDVLALKRTSNFARFLGYQVGNFAGCDIDKSLNFKMDVNIDKPLRRVVKMIIEGKAIWIRLTHVKLPNFFYDCGKLGHVYRGARGIRKDWRRMTTNMEASWEHHH
ncbi:LOW QUALITY PROTEIN: hypothetical protein Cgig2_006297 [Carnegiea gigantea]|uniref:DUF4283 domain-containing protein n=1 Tax=Carnegiea gigantea TaxID=171969 RepID=A0A9Q1K7L9_9CARY|nr:LOW QUALITY PROTEIN: hypothetical protein Cgig2_006297 [Carnegiea gigantea]